MKTLFHWGYPAANIEVTLDVTFQAYERGTSPSPDLPECECLHMISFVLVFKSFPCTLTCIIHNSFQDWYLPSEAVGALPDFSLCCCKITIWWSGLLKEYLLNIEYKK